jgi:hypothetical protein
MEGVTWKSETPDEDGKRQMVLAGMDPGDDHQSKRVRLASDGGDAGGAGQEIHHLKMLVPEKETGNVIGRGGELLRQVRSESGARVHISAMDEVLPVTRERIITISGALPSLLCAQHLISETLQKARHERAQKIAASSGEPAPVVDGTRTLKLLFPHVSCGVIMGRGGSFIKELMVRKSTACPAAALGAGFGSARSPRGAPAGRIPPASPPAGLMPAGGTGLPRAPHLPGTHAPLPPPPPRMRRAPSSRCHSRPR